MTDLTRRSFTAALLSGAAAIALSGCGDGGAPAGGGEVEAVVVTDAVRNRPLTELHRGNGAEPGSLDPHFTQGTWESAIVRDMLMGLWTEDADANAIYGAAESHTVSADGKTWTIKIRAHSWSDGTPVTAADFVYAWRRILDPKTAARYANLLYTLKGAQEVNTGAPAETLAARATDPQTLVLETVNPAPYLPQLMTHQTMMPAPRQAIEAHGKDWTQPGKYVGNGPYILAEWRPNDHIRLTKNPRFYDAANVKIETVYFYPTEDTIAATNRFRAGEFDTNDGIPVGRIEWLRTHLGDAVKLDPFLAFNYLTVNATRPPFGDVRVRLAIAMALDRETISEKVIKFGEPAAYSFVPPKTANYPGTAAFRWKDMPFADRLKEAQRLMTDAGFSASKRLACKFNTGQGPDARRIAAVVQQQMAQVFIDLEIVQSDSAVHFDQLQSGNFDIAAASWVADYNDAKNFLFLLLSDNPKFNYGRYNNPRFDALYKQSEETADAVERGRLQAEAAQLALDEVGIVPNRFLAVRNLVQPYVKGWRSNVMDKNPTRWLSIEGPRTPAGRTT